MSTFSTCSHCMTTKFVSRFSWQFFIKFYIEIADDTFQFFNCVVGQKYLKNVIRLFYKLTYSFVAIYFWCFIKIHISFFYLKIAHKFGGNIFYIPTRFSDWQILIGVPRRPGCVLPFRESSSAFLPDNIPWNLQRWRVSGIQRQEKCKRNKRLVRRVPVNSG